MPKRYQQKRSVSPPLPTDKALNEFTSVIQENLADLWEVAHDHSSLEGSSTEVTSISKSGSDPLTGNVTLSGGSNVTLTQVGQDITITASDTDTGITQLTGDVTAGPGNGSQAATVVWSAVSTAHIVTRETPSGLVNSSNTVYTLFATPVVGSEHVFLNGLLQTLTADYGISGATITFVTAPLTGDILRVSYQK